MKDNKLIRLGKIINTLSLVAPNLVSKFILFKFSRPIARKGFGEKNKAYLKNQSGLEFKTINKQSIACYHWQGKGPKILLCHGWESNSSRWQSLNKLLLVNAYDVYAFDAPAHGFSAGSSINPEAFIAVIHKLNEIHNFDAIVGHSYGGFNALLYADSHQQSLKKLIVLAPTNSIQDVVISMQKRMGFSDKLINSFIKVFTKKFGEPPSAYRSDNFVKQIDVKGLIIHDKTDQVLPLAGSELIHQNWKNSKLVVTEGLGHRVKSKQVNEAILNFLNGQ